MADVLFVRAVPYVAIPYDTNGAALAAFYRVPVGSTEGATADTLRTQVGDPNGSVWIGVTTSGGVAKLKNLNPVTGALISEVTLASMTTINDGYTLILLPAGEFLVSGIAGGVRILKRYTAAGAVAQTYSLPADTVTNIGLASDGKTLYYQPTGSTTMKRWNLSTDAAATDFGTLTNWDGPFVMLPDDRVLGVFSSGGGPVAKLINTDASVAMVYTPSSALTSSSTIGGVAYDLAREHVYFSCCHTGGAQMGILMAFDIRDGSTTLWSTDIATVTSNTVGKVCLCPPLGSPQAYITGTDSTEAIRCMRICPILSHENIRTVFDELWFDVQTGQPVEGDGQMIFWVAISKDSGQSWGPAFAIPASRQGQYLWRVIRRRLGQGRNMVFQVWTDSPAGQVWLQAILKIRPGTS